MREPPQWYGDIMQELGKLDANDKTLFRGQDKLNRRLHDHLSNHHGDHSGVSNGRRAVHAAKLPIQIGGGGAIIYWIMEFAKTLTG